MGRDSSDCTATRYRLDGPGIESRRVARFPAPVQTGHGAHPASYTSDEQTTARGPDAVRLEFLAGPRQILK